MSVRVFVRYIQGDLTYPCDDRACSDRGAFADDAMRHDDRSRADVYFVFDDDGTGSEFRLAAFALDRLISAAENNVFADVDTAADGDVGGIFYSTVGADECIVADVDVVAVIASKRTDNDDLRANTTRTGQGS